MLKRALLGFVLVIILLSTAQGSNVPTQAGLVTQKDAAELQDEIHLLRAINLAGLSIDQLQRIQALVSDLRTTYIAQVEAQLELKDFLLQWQGSRDDFEKALEPFERKIQEAHQAVIEKGEAAIEQLKDMLSYRQGELLFEALKEVAVGKMTGPSTDLKELLLANLELLYRVLNEKIQAIGSLPRNCTATVNLTALDLVYNDSVGNDWSFAVEINDARIAVSGPTQIFQDQFEGTLELKIRAIAQENDSVPDVGSSSETITIECPETQQVEEMLTLEVRVRENRGRYAGNTALWRFDFSIKAEPK